MKKMVCVLLACLNLSCTPKEPENIFTGEYSYWSDSKDFESVLLKKVSDSQRLILLKGKTGTQTLTGTVEGKRLSSEGSDGTTYIFRLNGTQELRMHKQYQNYTSPEDIEWIFFRNP